MRLADDPDVALLSGKILRTGGYKDEIDCLLLDVAHIIKPVLIRSAGQRTRWFLPTFCTAFSGMVDPSARDKDLVFAITRKNLYLPAVVEVVPRNAFSDLQIRELEKSRDVNAHARSKVDRVCGILGMYDRAGVLGRIGEETANVTEWGIGDLQRYDVSRATVAAITVWGHPTLRATLVRHVSGPELPTYFALRPLGVRVHTRAAFGGAHMIFAAVIVRDADRYGALVMIPALSPRGRVVEALRAATEKLRDPNGQDAKVKRG